MGTTKNEVAAFLKRLRAKASIYGIIYEDDRPKNTQTLATLELRPKDRDEVIQKIVVEDYSEGPKPENFLDEDAEIYVFGKLISDYEIYIKVTQGKKNNKIICISFHIAEHPLDYPFK